jgi:hypothetical protein
MEKRVKGGTETVREKIKKHRRETGKKVQI